jgi:hypothetical protein
MFLKNSKSFKILKLYKKNMNTDIALKLSEFKSIINKLLEEKIYHYSMLNYDAKELSNLNIITKQHILMLDNYIQTNKAFKSANFNNEKFCTLNNFTIFMDYYLFIDLIKYAHEKKEEEINNFLRDEYEKNNITQNDILIRLRDEWRDCFLPDLLDNDSKPIYNYSFLNKVNSEINKNLINILL